MVLDTSAVLAILFGETEAEDFARALADADTRLMSAFSVLEASVVVMAKKGEAAVRELDLLLHTANVDVVPFDADQSALARSAYERFGKGRHGARLNLGDCCSYALARTSNEPLLFKGNDFSKTDIQQLTQG